MNAKNGFPVFSTHIEANYISKSTDAWNVYKLTDEDRQKITAMAADPRIGEWAGLWTVHCTVGFRLCSRQWAECEGAERALANSLPGGACV
jgi:hypothetical protein